MATTTNFGWETPDDTDLVKDGAAAIRTLGQSIDTSMADLEGGTTGQILAKNSNTDMDFVWIANDQGDITAVTAGTGISGGGTSGAVTVTNSMATAITTAGDLIKGTGSGTFDRLGIGSTGQVLTVASGAPAWATPSAGGKNYSLLGTGTTTSGSTVTVSGISGIDDIFILLRSVSSNSANESLYIRLNSDSSTIYNQQIASVSAPSAYSSTIVSNYDGQTLDRWQVANMSSSATSTATGGLRISGCNSSGVKMLTTMIAGNAGGSQNQSTYHGFGYYTGSSTISSVSLMAGAGTFDAGSFLVYGSA